MGKSRYRPISTGRPPRTRMVGPAVLLALVILAGLAGTSGATGSPNALLRAVGDTGRQPDRPDLRERGLGKCHIGWPRWGFRCTGFGGHP